MRGASLLRLACLFPLLGGLHLLGQTAPPNLLGISGGGSVELGQRIVLQVSLSGAPTGLAYQWRKGGADISEATGATYTIAAVTAADAGTYAVAVSNSAGSSVATTDLTVKAAAAPVITTPPRAQVAQVGQTVTFSFVATGSYPRTYQWRKDGADINGATDAALSLNNITTADAGVYVVVVGNALGSATSSSASLTVNAASPPVLSSFSPNDVTATQGQQLNLNVSLSSGSSPFSYQWLKSGTAIPGATNATLIIPAIALTDAGKYSVTVTNIAGSATSREATVIVNAATPVTVIRGPESLAVAVGQFASFSVSLSAGTTPISYQWSKNGTAIPGATLGSYSINAVTAADAGNYTVAVGNVLGTVTPAAATLTVTPAVAPTITAHPSAQNVGFNSGFSLNVQASGTTPFTYQWRKDGTPIPGATFSNYSVSSATPANSGAYSVVVGNSAGTATSNAASVVVAAAIAPTITTQPKDAEVAVGLNVSFSVNVSSNGTGQLTVQWLKNGGPIPGANSNTYVINSAREGDAGSYSAVITGAGGSVTSTAARLTVLPPAAPKVSYWSTGVTSVALGASATLTVANNIDGTAPFSYQWSKNGAPIAGATNNSLSLPAVSVADYATYTLTISNEGGVITSPGLRLANTISYPAFGTPAALPWVDTGRIGDIVYFLATTPARIERYDLAAERWLPTVLLSDTKVPTAFVPASEGVYIAYGRTLSRRPLDLSTETALTNTPTDITVMFLFGDFLYYNAGPSAATSGINTTNYSTLNRTTLQPGPTASIGSFYGAYRQIAPAPTIGKAFARTTGISPADIVVFSIGPDGKVSGETDAPYHGTMPIGSRVFVLPGDQFVADDSGTVYRTSNLTFAGSFGEAFTDLAFLGDGTPVVLRGSQLTTARSDTFIETGRTTLAQPALRLFTRGTSAFAFAGPTTGATSFSVAKIAAADLRPATPSASTAIPTGRYSIDDAFLGENNIVHIFSRTVQGFIRWDPATRAFLSTLPLRDAPALLFHQPGNRRALVSYADGVVTEFPLTSGASERTLFNFAHRVRAITDLGDMVMVNFADAQDSGDQRLLFGASGGPKFINTSLYEGTGLAWVAASRRLYSTPAFSSGLQYEIISAAGTLGTSGTGGQTTSAVGTVTPPIRFNSDNTLLVTANGRVLNADLASVGVLANDITDGAWLGNSLYTVRSLAGQTQVQQWARSTYLLAGTASVRGTPVRILRLSDAQLLVVSSVQGFLALTLVNADLSIVTPPEVRSLAGVYFAKVSPAGDLALQVRPDGTGTLLASLPGTRAAILAKNVAVNADGSFVVSATDVTSGNARTVAGTISSDGSIAGSIPVLNLTFAGARVNGTTAAGFYQASAVNGSNGNAYALVGPDGRAVVAAQSSSTLESGAGTGDSAGTFRLTTSTGAQLTFAIDAGAGTLTTTADRDTFASITFAGLRDDVARTDRLGNISTRGRASSGEDAMIAGFVITGTAQRTVLIRAIGPALGNFGLVGTLGDPKLTLFRGGTQVAESDNWSSEPSAVAIVNTAGRVGAFALPSPGRDAVLLSTLEPGNYTAQVTPATGGGGVALVEVYDAGTDTAAGTPKLINIATRGRVGSGEDVLIAGIVVTGNAPKRVLVRAVGPTLATFGVGGALADPVLTLLAGTKTLVTNDDWGVTTSGVTAGDIVAATTSVGAFALPVASRDAALLITLQPGSYTAQVSGKGPATGVALVEVYEVNN